MTTPGTVTMRIDEAYDDLPNHLDNPHLAEQVDRIMPVLRLVVGERECPTVEQVRRDVATGIQALRAYPDAPSARCGSLLVCRSVRNEAENFEVFVMSAEVFGFQVWVHGQKREREGSGVESG